MTTEYILYYDLEQEIDLEQIAVPFPMGSISLKCKKL